MRRKNKEDYRPAMIAGAIAALVILAWMLAAHLEYVELSTDQLYCWDFAAGDLAIDRECNEVLAAN